MIEHWFSVPILFEDNLQEKDLIQKEIGDVLLNIKKSDLISPWQDNVQTTFKFDQSNNDIEKYKLVYLKSAIDRIAKKYVETNTNSSNQKNLFISESWFNFYDKGMFQYSHVHGFSYLSGVYYYKTNENDGNIVFDNPNIYVRDQMCDIGIHEVVYRPKIGRLILFPSWLAHRVLPNNTNEQRISLSFNLRQE